MYFKEVLERHPDWKAVRVGSFMNPWIDCMVFIPEEQISTCKQACMLGMTDFYELGYEPYGDYVKRRLQDANIPHEIIYCALNLEEDDTTDAWEYAVDVLHNTGIVIDMID